MSLLSKVVVEIEKNGNKYEFIMPNNVPVQDCFDAAQDVVKEIVEFSKHQAEANEQAAQREKEADGITK